MFNKKMIAASVSVPALLAAGAVSAQDFYAGVTAGNMWLDGGSQFPTAGGVVGATWNSGNMSYGGEVSVDSALNGGNFLVSRLRGLAEIDSGNVTFFGAAGATFLSFNSGGPSYWGYNIGAGVSIPISGNFDVRVEVVRDQMPNYVAGGMTSAKIGATFNF